MWGHVSDERLIDVLEGAADASSRAHAESCERCRERLSGLRSGLSLAREADVPEPSPLYWETFRKQVDVRLVREVPAARWSLRPAFAVAAALLALMAVLPGPRQESGPVTTATLPAWSALPPVTEDANFAVLQGLEAPEEDLLAASPQRISAIVADLSDAERQRLAEALESVLRGKS